MTSIVHIVQKKKLYKMISRIIKVVVLLSLFSMGIYAWLFFHKGLRNLETSCHQFEKANGSLPIATKNSLQLEQTDWQEVPGTEYHFNIYSAYYLIDHSPSEVLVIGTAITFTDQKIFCRIYFNEDGKQPEDPTTVPSHYIQVPGTIQTMEENWDMTYAGIFIHCPLSKAIKPEVVSILLPNQTEPSNMIRVQNQRNGLKLKHDFKFSLCVLPLYDFNEVIRLVEWIEFHKMMGVEQITLFNVSIGPQSSCILHDLMEGNDPSIKVNVLPWHKNPIKNTSLIRSTKCAECALSAGSTDCLYRHRGTSKYMMLVDLDEFIMPRKNIAKNYSQLIDYLDAQHPEENIGHYQFKNGFFIRFRPDDPMLNEICSGFRSNPLKYRVCHESFLMSKVWREDYQPYSARTKYIIKPEGVNQTGTHFANVLEPGYTTLRVKEEVAFVRHYRYYNFGRKGAEIDRVAQGFGNELVENVAERLSYFSRKCKFLGFPSYDWSF